MELSGTIEENLKQAVQSARKLQGHPVYTDTLKYWAELLQMARATKDRRSQSGQATIEALVMDLEAVLSER